jgi:hypothetical protein
MTGTVPAKIVVLMEVIIAFLTIIYILSDFISMKDLLKKLKKPHNNLEIIVQKTSVLSLITRSFCILILRIFKPFSKRQIDVATKQIRQKELLKRINHLRFDFSRKGYQLYKMLSGLHKYEDMKSCFGQ